MREEKQELERVKDMKNCDVNHSNMLNQSEHDLKKSSVIGFLKVNASTDKLIRLPDGGDFILQDLRNTSPSRHLDPSQEENADIIEIIMKKFNSS